MIRAVIDTNVIVSGLLFGGLPLKIVQAGLTRRFAWVRSPPLMEEVERVLSYKKFGLTKAEVQILLGPIFRVVEVVIPTETIDAIPSCPGDNRVLECAVEGRCRIIATGDRRDLVSLKRFRQIDILTVREFLEIL